jgi:putative FmdB family regulatory protein
MPTYDYKCPGCGTVFERVQKMKDPHVAKCPKCGAKAERQLSGGHGIVFKGSGFYETDYKRAGEKRASKEGSKDSSPSSGASPSPGSTGPTPSPGSSGPSSPSGSKD